MSRTVFEENDPGGRLTERADTKELASILGIESFKGDGNLSKLPFLNDDVTAGGESEYQTAVFGDKNDADLPSAIKASKYYANLMRRIQAGEIPKSSEHLLKKFVNDNKDGIWENSWVRFPIARLKRSTWDLFLHDLLEDKDKPDGPNRRDYHRFFSEKNGESWIRIPISYLLKLALVDALTFPEDDRLFFAIRTSLAEHFLNDNSSPETYSFFPVRPGGFGTTGRNLAEETLLRFLLSQFTLMYASRAFGLKEYGQKPLLYFAPSVPLRMRNLNTIVSDSFYRELFMSPCLSGWGRGYEKHEYMHLCHQVLSRSHLNSVFRFKEAGILRESLIKLDSISNTSLANNGTHVSLGSGKLGALAASGEYTAAIEKAAGDLVIKIMEHFLPLFPNLYSASPWRIAYRDFRPENVAGFLAHELTNTHLRMLWRRWAKKAGIEFFGKVIPAKGPIWYEDFRGAAMGMKGIFVPDMRLADYFVALMSTPESPALSGTLGNDRVLKADLASQGVFDERMSVYLPVKLREFEKMGFTGFEARHYSIFDSILIDMTEAVDLQQAITAFAFKAVIEGRFTHEDIPDDQFTESERRQILFSSALAIETVNIREANPNRVMEEILSHSPSSTLSGRYTGFRKIKLKDYRLGLIELLRKDIPLMKALGTEDLFARCEDRIRSGVSSGDRLTEGILGERKKGALSFSAEEFNSKAEHYYREDLKRKHLKEALEVLKRILSDFRPSEDLSRHFGKLFAGNDPSSFIDSNRKRILAEDLELEEIVSLISAVSLILYQGKRDALKEQ